MTDLLSEEDLEDRLQTLVERLHELLDKLPTKLELVETSFFRVPYLRRLKRLRAKLPREVLVELLNLHDDLEALNDQVNKVKGPRG